MQETWKSVIATAFSVRLPSLSPNNPDTYRDLVAMERGQG